MAQELNMTEEEAGEILAKMRREDMSLEEMEIRLAEDYNFYTKYGIRYYYDISEFHKGSAGKLMTIWTGAFQSIPIPTTWAENSRISAAFFWDLRRCFCWRSFHRDTKGIPGSCCTQSR